MPDYATKTIPHCFATLRKKMHTLLIIDDDPDYQYLLATLLGFDGYKILKATNPLEAMPIIQKDKIDLIIMELKNQYLEGIQFIKWMNNEVNIEIPILIITALQKNEAQEMVKAVQLKYILHKPSYKKNIINKIKRLIKN